MPRGKMILDVDTGTDDAVAIRLAALHPDLERVACTTGNGHVEVSCWISNTLRVLGIVGSGDVSVCQGLEQPIARCTSTSRPTDDLRSAAR